MTLPCPHYAPVSGSHFSQLLITRQCRVLPLPTSCQPFPPSLTSRAPQPLHLESARLCVLQSSSIVLSCLRPASVSSLSVLPIPPSRPLHLIPGRSLALVASLQIAQCLLRVRHALSSTMTPLATFALRLPQDAQPCLSQILLCPSTKLHAVHCRSDSLSRRL